MGPWISIASNPHIGPCPFGEGDIMDKVEALWTAAVEEYGYDTADELRAFCGLL